MSTVQEVLNKLQKLKQQTIAAPDFSALEKVQAKLEKIRSKTSEHRSYKQFVEILDNIQKLIAEKKKYFRQIIIKNSQQMIAQDNARNQEAERTLKYSKSAESLKLFVPKNGKQGQQRTNFVGSKTVIEERTEKDETISENKMVKFDARKKKNHEEIEFGSTTSELKNSQIMNASKKNIKPATMGSAKSIRSRLQQNQEDADRTTVNDRKNNNQKQNQSSKIANAQIGLLEQKLSFSFKQIEDLNKKIQMLEDYKQKNSRQIAQHTSPSAKNYLAKQQSIVDDYSRKLREKNFMIEDLKSKLEYLKTMNDELKNKIINQQRKNEDYIEDIKQQNKKLKKDLELVKRQNENFKLQLEDLEQKNQGLLGQIKKLVNKLQQQSKDKQNIRKNLTASASTKTQQLQKQIQALNAQCSSLSKLEIRLQQQQDEKQQLVEFRKKLEERVGQLEGEAKRLEDQRNKLELQLYKMEQEKKYLTCELKVSKQSKQILADELLNTRQQLAQQSKTMSLNQYQNELKAKNKINKLKEVKSLLTQLQ